MTIFKQLIINADVLFGSNIPIHHKAYIAEGILTDGKGIYKREEWSEARKKGYNKGGEEANQLDSSEKYISRALTVERRKVLTGLRMADKLELNKECSILELGAGEMISAWTIKSSHPSIKYTATDFDSFIIEKCSQLETLKSIEKKTLDILRVSTNELSQYQFILAWDVFYNFSDQDLEAFLSKVKAAKSKLLIASSQMTGPFRTISYLTKNLILDYRKKEAKNLIRHHGYKVSLAYYKKAARKSGLTCHLISMPPMLRKQADTYFFIEFS